MKSPLPPSVQFIERGPKTHVLVGFESSGALHLGHYLILKRLKRELREDPSLKVTLLLSDVHARLNFKRNVRENTQSLKIFLEKLVPSAQVVIYSDIIKDPVFWGYFLSFVQKINFNDVFRATPEEVKLSGIEEMRSLPGTYFCYSVMQCVDSHYFKADTVYAGTDQRKIYMLAFDTFSKLNWPKFNLALFPLVSAEGVITRKVEEKMSKSKTSVPLDKDLLTLCERELKKSPTFLSHFCTKQLCVLYGSEDKEQFLKELTEDLSFLKDDRDGINKVPILEG